VKYRHAFHAGNFADAHKHATLLALLRALARKDKGFLLLDTHAGRGGYDLSSSEAHRSHEADEGIERLLDVTPPAAPSGDAAAGAANAAWPAEIADYLAVVQSFRRERHDRTAYPGSPLIALLTLRPQDRAVFIETQPAEHAALREAVSQLARYAPSAVAAARRGIPVYHLEAGNRCFDNRVPEEVNRRVIDHCSDVLLPYTERSAENLVREGIRRDRIFVTGNPILEVLEHYAPQIAASGALARLALSPKGYFLVTMHRAENVDDPARLADLLGGLDRVAAEFGKPCVVSVHPRTADRIRRSGIKVDERRLRLMEPFGLFDFIALEKAAAGVVTDSGTVQEEACIFGIPNVTLRDVTERPETTECGSNILSGRSADLLVSGMRLALGTPGSWSPPPEYAKRNVAATVARIVLSYRHPMAGY